MKEVYLMKKRKTDEKGFTLIEVIVTLVLVGITAALAGMWIVSVVNGYIFAKTNANTVQKAQLAMTRLVEEFSKIKSVYPISDDVQIKYKRSNSSFGDEYYKVFKSSASDELKLAVTTDAGNPTTGGDTLTDTLSSIGLRYCNADNTSCETTWSSASRIIEITLILTGANNTTSTFTQRVTPRNL
jgi:prepilin-type N-terminal cleavage/methylation domain-containing protein